MLNIPTTFLNSFLNTGSMAFSDGVKGIKHIYNHSKFTLITVAKNVENVNLFDLYVFLEKLRENNPRI